MNPAYTEYQVTTIKGARLRVREEEHDADASLFQDCLIDLMEGFGASEDHETVKTHLGALPLSPAAVDLLHAVLVNSLKDAPAGAAPSLAPAQKYDDTLLPFLELMRKELHANADKGDRPGWLKMSADTALLEIYWHTAKLSAAVKNNDGPAIIEHSADVANMAMMLLDVCGGIPTTQPAPSVLEDWRLDHSAGRPILVYKDCSVIEAEQAQEVLDALRASRGQAQHSQPQADSHL